MQSTAETNLVDLRVRRLLEGRLLPRVYERRSGVDVAAWSVPAEPVSRREGLSGPFAAFPPDGKWGPAWGTTWFRIRGEVPSDWAGKPVCLHVEISPAGATGFCAEALACDALGRALQGITPNHPDVLLVARAEGGEHLECYLEAAANPPHPPLHLYDWPLLSPEPDGPLLFSISCELVVADHEVGALIADMTVLYGLLESATLERSRAGQVRAALARACDAIDAMGVDGGLKVARAALGHALSRPASASAHRVTACGHSHIDSAWLWPLREGRRKCVRTFATIMALMDAYPDFVFAASSAQHFAWVQQDDPVLFERIKERVREGRFIPVGGFWVESDVNIPFGESLVRQLLFGIRFFEKELAVRVEEGWLPDAFGYSAALPQLLRQADLAYFVTQKLSTNEYDRFPHSSFFWEGIDGSRVFAHFPPTCTYSGKMTPDELERGLEEFSQHGAANRSLYLFGYGDGGGGPTAEMIEAARRLRDLEGAPAVDLGNPRSFLRAAREELTNPPVWTGELYFERHRGTFTSQAATKAGLRRAELGLRRAEVWSCLAAGAADDYPLDALQAAWKTLLINQFHDIAPGSSINCVHKQSEAELARVVAEADAVTLGVLNRLAATIETKAMSTPIMVANSQGHERVDVVTLHPADLQPDLAASSAPLVAVDRTGAAHPVQVFADGQLGFLAAVPPFGYACYDLRTPRGDEPHRPGATLEVDICRLENSHLRVELDDDGCVVSVFDKHARREVLAGPGNVLQLFPDYPVNNDAWDIDRSALDQPEAITAVDEVVVEEDGPVRATLRISRRVGSSRIVQRLSLCATHPWLDVANEVDWHERHRLLKVAFPLAVRSPRACFEVAFGLVERPTCRNTSWDVARFEVCGHRFADLSEPGYGVALANDCKYGYDVTDNIVRLSLLRSPTAPDPLADQGEHRFSYRLVPHVGELGPGGVVEAAHDLNDPLWAVVTTAHPGVAPERARLLFAEPSSIVVDTVKRAEDGDELVIRCYEAWGGRTTARLHLPPHCTRAIRSDILERDVEELVVGTAGVVEFAIGPFEVVTVKASPLTAPPSS